MAGIPLNIPCSLEQLLKENTRLQAEIKSNRLQAQERFDAATCVLKCENQSLKQKLESVQAKFDSVMQSIHHVKETNLPRIDAQLCAQFAQINRIQKRKQIDDVPAPAALAALVLPPLSPPSASALKLLKKDITDILNQLTPGNFEELSERFLALEINAVDRAVMCAQLLHETAVKFATHSRLYADLCKKLRLQLQLPQATADDTAPAAASIAKMFIKTLLDACQAEFDNIFSELAPEVAEAVAELSFEQRLIENSKRLTKQLGSITFIAELYNCEMVKNAIMLEILDFLVFGADDEDDNVGCSGVSLTEERLLCVCRLVITAGQRLEAEEKGRVKLRMSFDRLDAASAAGNAAYSSNVRSALKDLRELRKTGWVPCNVQQKRKVAGT